MTIATAMATADERLPRLRRFGDGVAWLSTRISGIGLTVIVAINFANVVGRYFFAQPISWAEEAMLYLMVLVVFSALAAVTWLNAHIRIELMLDYLPPGLRTACTIASAVVVIAVCAVVSAESVTVVSMLHAFDQRSEAMEFPVWIPQACVAIGLMLTGLLTALRLLVPAPKADHIDAG